METSADARSQPEGAPAGFARAAPLGPIPSWAQVPSDAVQPEIARWLDRRLPTMHPRHPWAAAPARATPLAPAASPAALPATTSSPAAPTPAEPSEAMSEVTHAQQPLEHPGWPPYDPPHDQQHYLQRPPGEDPHHAQQHEHHHPHAFAYPHHPAASEHPTFPHSFDPSARSYGGAVPLSTHTRAPLSASPPSATTASYCDNGSGGAGNTNSRKRAWDDTADGSARAGDDGQSRMRPPPPGGFLRPSAPASLGDERFFAPGGARAGEGDVPPTPESAGYHSQSPYYSSSSEAASRSPTMLSAYAYDRAPPHPSTGLYPYPPSRPAHDASHPPLPSPLSHVYTPPASFSPPPNNVLAPYQQEHPQPFPTSLPPVSVPPSTWAVQRTQAYDMPPMHSPAFRPSTTGGSALPQQHRPSPSHHLPSPSVLNSYPPGAPSSLPPTQRSSFSSGSFAYSADPAAYPPRRAGGIPSYLETPSYPLQQQARPVTTSSLPSMSLSAPATAGGPYNPYHNEPQLTAYPSNGASASGSYPSPSASHHQPGAHEYPPPPAHSTSWAAPMGNAQDSSAYPPRPHKPRSPPPTILPETLPQLQQASTARAIHRSSAPILAFNPAREPASTGKQLVQSSYGVTYAVAASGSSKGKAKSAEVGAVCYTCGKHRAKVILRGSDLSGWAPRLNYSCLDCLPIDDPKRGDDDHGARRERLAERAYEADCAAEGSGDAAGEQSPTTSVASGTTSGSALLAALPGPTEHDRATFKDTFSGAVDYIEGGPGHPAGATGAEDGDSRLHLPPEETSRGLPAHLKRQALVCDVCDRTIGAGSISSLTQGAPPAFTVEVICNGCADKYKPCSDCGGGGGRLTPGRWRCKELFPAGRRTCTLSHARNPPLNDIDYDVLRVTEIDPRKLEALEARCRLVYFNTRLRTQARPEMLERGDGLATTYAQCEKLVVDGWSLLSPLMSVDVEASRGIRRYVAVQTSTPHRRRAKPKPGAAPRPEPELEDPLEKEVSGFLLVEHDLENGATFVAVTMPWAISGDAFDATTILIDETIKRIRTHLQHDNAVRREHGEAPYPEPWCLWGVTPFKADSRMTQSLSRRSFIFLEEYMRDKPDTDLSIFPPTREIHIPNEFVKTFKIFIRDMTDDDGNGLPASVSGNAAAAAKKPPRQRARKLKAK